MKKLIVLFALLSVYSFAQLSSGTIVNIVGALPQDSLNVKVAYVDSTTTFWTPTQAKGDQNFTGVTKFKSVGPIQTYWEDTDADNAQQPFWYWESANNGSKGIFYLGYANRTGTSTYGATDVLLIDSVSATFGSVIGTGTKKVYALSFNNFTLRQGSSLSDTTKFLSNADSTTLKAGLLKNADSTTLKNGLLSKADSAHNTVYYARIAGAAPSKTYYVSLAGSLVDSSSGTADQIAAAPFISAKGVYKNIRVKNYGNVQVDTCFAILAKASAVETSGYSDTALLVNAPASATGTYSASTTESSVAADGDIYVLKIRTTVNGSFTPSSIFVSFDFYPDTN